MNKIIIIMFFLISINLFSWTTIFSDDGLCNKYANFTVNTASFSNSSVQIWNNYIPTNGFHINNFNLEASDVKFAAQIAANWWNEAGSEHHLYYQGEGSDYVEIFLMYDNDTWAMQTFPLWVVAIGDGICINNTGSFIRVNEKYWNTSKNIITNNTSGIDFITTLTHEFGHLLGLNHYDNTYNIMLPGAGFLREVQEDDKYGVRKIYGKDDRIIKTTTGIWNDSLEELTLASNTYSYEWYSQYETFAEPSIVYQPDASKGYDYIITWVESNSKNVKYAFAKDSGDDLVTYAGPFTITGSQTLTTPSIAINKTGDTAVLIYKYEGENISTSYNGRIEYVEINTSTGQYLNHSYLWGYENGTLEIPYSKSAPIITWRQEWPNSDFGRFIIFWSERNNNRFDENKNWRIKYIISDDNGSSFLSEQSKIKTLKTRKTVNGTIIENDLNVMWQPMAVDCNFTSIDQYHTSCVLFFNETFPNSTIMDYQRLTRVFMQYDSLNELIVDKDISNSHHFRYDDTKYNYGHLNLVKTPSTTDKYLLTYMSKAAKSTLKAYRVNIFNNNQIYYGTSTTSASVLNNSNKKSRTGFSGVFNNRTNKFRFIWIEE